MGSLYEMEKVMPDTEICDLNRLPLANVDFSNIREQNKIYVDKIELIYKIAKQDLTIFFSRPRRFGKLLFINTLSCLFEKGIDYFQGLDIENLWHDHIYKVVHIDFSGIANSNPHGFNFSLS